MAEGTSIYTIEKGVPLPAISRARAGGRVAKYPFDSMEVTDSFCVEYGEEDSKKVTRRVRTAILVYKRNKANKEKKFNTRQLDQGDPQTNANPHIRVWRSE